MTFMYGIDQSNPRGRMARAQAQRKAMWASFQHFLDKADSFILHYWPPDEDVAPLLALGFAPQPTELSPKARCLHGTLTPELRKLLWGPGKGEVPWSKVELVRDGQLIYYVEEHEDTAGWNGTEETLHELYKAGVDPAVVINYVEFRRKHFPVSRAIELLALAAAQTANPSSTGYSYGMMGETAELGIGNGHKVWLEYDLDALVSVNDQEAAAAVMAQVAPLLPGDALWLELVDGVPALTRKGRGLGPWRRNFTHIFFRPDRTEWLTALRLLGHQADRFVFCWMEEPAVASGWRSDYGRERLTTFATDVGPTDFPAHARQMVGPVTPDLLAVITGEPPHGLIDGDAHGPAWHNGGVSPSPWWWLLFVAGQEIIFESRHNGYEINLKLRPDEAAALQPPGDRLYSL